MKIFLTKCPKCDGPGRVVDSTAVGNAMRLMRKSARVSLRRMSDELGISFSFLGYLERGEREWTLDLRVKYRQVLDSIHAEYSSKL